MNLHPEVYIEPDRTVAPLPSRSQLFSLEPIGIGTEDCESLLSYLVRLALAHSIGARVFFREVIFKECGNLGGLKYPVFFNIDARSVNGIGKYAKVFANVANELTSRNDLHLMTMLPWQGIFPEKGAGLISRHPRWCKSCLRAQHKQAKGAYFPLAWSLELHGVCHKHSTKLNDRCPWCSRRQPIIPFAPYLDRCAYCLGWLASENTSEQPEDTASWNLWVAKSISDMISHNPAAENHANHESFRSLLVALINQHADGEKKKFSKLLGMTDSTMSCWITKGKMPTFPQFLKLCHWLDALPSELFNGPGSKSSKKTPKADQLPELYAIKPRTGRYVPNKSKISMRLKIIIGNHDDHRSLKEIACDLKVTARYLRYWFPRISTEITAKRKKHLSSLATEKLKDRKVEVRNTTLRIHQNGTYPSKGRVSRELKPLRIYLQSPKIRDAYKKAISALPS